MEKICSKCGEEKPATNEFFYSNGGRGYLKSRCKTCDNARRLDGQKKERATGKFKERDAMYAEKYKEKRAIQWKDYYQKNRDRLIEVSADNFKERYKNDSLFRSKVKLRAFVNESIKRGGFSKSKKSQEILGISIAEFLSYIEQQFQEGMTWENRNEWHIDHIIPFATAKTEEEVIRLNHYTNLRPLWAIDNMKKGARLDWTQHYD